MIIQLNQLPSDEPELNQSKLLRAFEMTIEYAEMNNGIGLTKSQAFNRKFATWAAENFYWPEYSKEKLLRIQKVLNEEDVLPVMVIHDLMEIMKLGRHMRDGFKLSKRAKVLAVDRGKLFAELTQTYLFQYNHDRTSRYEFAAPGNWDIFLNVINVEAQQGLTEQHLVKTLYGYEHEDRILDRQYHAHSGFLLTHVLRPLCWIGFLEAVRETDNILERPVYWKTPLWSKCLTLDTDRYLETPTFN
ncbi:MAG: hypothetical protein ABJH63_15300 [Rhizobiaceae bacterium]